MITARVNVFADFPAITAELEARTVRACDEAAVAGRSVAEAQAEGISDVLIVATHPTADGFRSGIKFTKHQWLVFDKGSLGKRTARLKRPNSRKESWRVRRGTNPYTAHRRDVTGKGIAARNISNPARAAGRKALIAGIHRL